MGFLKRADHTRDDGGRPWICLLDHAPQYTAKEFWKQALSGDPEHEAAE